jgi:hypothetical protein
LSEYDIHDKTTLIQEIEAARGRLRGWLNGLDEPTRTQARDHAGWTVADHVYHLSLWERSAINLLNGVPRHLALGVDEDLYRAGAEAVNEVTHDRRPDVTLPEALGELDAAHGELLATLAPLTDDDLMRSYSSYLPAEPGEERGDPVVYWVIGNSCGHYDEHLEWMRESFGDGGSPPG